ncbi:MAG: hypothetical protein ACI8PZ_000087 [Myxococcota bacterium]|jgi:hypothetical protein
MSRFLILAALVVGACGVEGEGPLGGDDAQLHKGEASEVIVVATHPDECAGADGCILLAEESEGACKEIGTAAVNLGAISDACTVENCDDCPRLCNPCMCTSIF